MKTHFAVVVLALRLAAMSSQAKDPNGVATPELIGRLVAEAIHNHPSTAAATARAQAAAAGIKTIRLWEDPQLGLGLTVASRSMREENGDIRIGFDQPLPRRRLYEAEKRKAGAELQVQQAQLRQTANDLGLSVAQSVLELALADEVLSLQAENLTWLQTMVKIAVDRARNPDATAAETLRLESELALRTQALAAARRQRTQLATTLNLLLGRNADSSWGSLTLPAPSRQMPGVPTIEANVKQNNPQLAALRHQIDGAQAEAEAANARRKPVFSLGVESNVYSGGDLLDGMFTLKMTLPWFNRAAYQADVARADKLRDAARHDLAAGQRTLETKMRELLTEARNQQQLAQAYADDVLPKSEKALTSLQSTWVSSKATLLDVLEARRTLLEARQEQKRAIAAQQAALQNLAALEGRLGNPTLPSP